MFTSDYQFKGIHAERIKTLAQEKFDKENTLFETLMDVYLLAPVVGFLYQRRAEVDKKSSADARIFADKMNKEKLNLEFNYRLIMLLDSEYESDFEKRVDKAFRDYGTDKSKADLDRYHEYVRGGIDVLYEKLWENATTADDHIKNLYEFMEDFENKYGQAASDDVLALCRQARS